MVFFRDKIFLLHDSDGKHLCCTCRNANKNNIDYANMGMTTVDINGCHTIQANANGDYHKIIKTEDNGGGYWITKCPFYTRDANFYNDYMASDMWQDIRERVFRRDEYKCRKCGTAKNLCVHHITYEHLGYEKGADLITLCKECHKKVHEKDLKGAE